MPAVSLAHLTKRFGADAPALDDLMLDVAPGEFLVLLGPSGCGKTTVLRLIAGLEEPSGGDIAIDGVRVNDLPPKDRDVAMVFQNYALYPHLSVRENIAFPLVMRRTPKAEARRRVEEVSAALGLTSLLARRPAQLSGGERQRVALGRAIVRQPKVFLFDEPLSNLDAKLRVQMRAELVRLHRRLGATMVYVTHDQVEAMTMGQRIAILHRGVLQQVGTPAEIYARPANVFVAAFIGAPGMNVIETGARGADAKTPSTAEGAAHGRAEVHAIGFRPEDARLVADEAGDFAGVVALVEPLGPEALVHVRLDAGETAVVRVREGKVPVVDERVGLAVPPGKLHAFGADGRRLGA
ncbi:MAG: ABC transporter ATP-binding protein [Gemmatimonadales bacterium]|jgi:multiple sugar transport system ATP-binding protein